MPDIIQELQKPLTSDRVKVFGSNAGAKKGLSYVEGHDVISEMNRVFGFAWSNQVASLNHVSTREYERNGKKMVEVTYECIVQVAAEIPVGDKLYKIQHDGVGGGSSSMPEYSTGEAYEFAAKNAETDALKRACMKYGDRFGLALYEKEQSRVEKPFDVAQARNKLFADVTKKFDLPKDEAIEYLQAVIKQVQPSAKAFDQLSQEEAEKVASVALTSEPKEFK